MIRQNHGRPIGHGTDAFWCWISALLMVVLLGTVSDAASPVPADELIQRAVDAYQAGMDSQDRSVRLQQFQIAESLFQQATAEVNRSPSLWVNLGNAALQAEDFGQAVVAYRRALSLEPAHQQAQANLNYVRSLMPKWLQYEPSNQLLRTILFWQYSFSPATLQLISALMFLVTALLVAASFRWSQPLLRMLAIVPAVVWMVLFVSGWAVRWAPARPEAVVMIRESVARSADSLTSTARFAEALPSGTEVAILERREDWVRIEVADQQTAWLPSSAVEEVP
ncbi:MAG: tetratricopeptide repeat protein [Planctomycetales bacterium]|nr:tetratricopeptide repeat protein [Planctomycetales bacterium]